MARLSPAAPLQTASSSAGGAGGATEAGGSFAGELTSPKKNAIARVA